MFCFLHIQFLSAQPPLKQYRTSEGEQICKDFDVVANGARLPVVSFKDINYIHFEQVKPTVITVSPFFKITGYEINPKQDASVQLIDNKLIISLKKANYYVVKINQQHTLFVFADLPVTAINFKSRKVKNILDYNVDNTGKTCETEKLQQALDDISKNRLTLYFPPGIYRTGTLKIGSHSDVFLEDGAILQGSGNLEDYPVDPGRVEFKNFNEDNGKDNGEIMTFSRLILIDNARNVKLRGRGVIDGNGAAVRRLGKPANLIRVRNSFNVLIEGLILRDPAAWNTHILYSQHIKLRDVKILNDRNIRNTDGIDPDASRNVNIQHCFAYCSDDNIAIKSSNNSGLLQNVRNITIDNCVFLTKKSALKIGTETKSAKISRVVFKNNEVVEADRGMALYCYDGAAFNHIKFTGNHFVHGFKDSKKKAIHFEIRDRSGKGSIKNVLIKDCVFEKTFHASSQMDGLSAGHSISGIKFKNTKTGSQTGLKAEDFNLKINEFTRDIIFSK